MNDQTREAMQMALEALEFDGFTPNDVYHRGLQVKAITALREALAQPQDNLNCKSVQARLATLWGYVKAQPQGEPVAWMYQFRNEAPVFCTEKRDWADNHSEWKEMPLYATPPPVEAAIEATKEKAAKVCEGKAENYATENDAWANQQRITANLCAKAIRRME